MYKAAQVLIAVAALAVLANAESKRLLNCPDDAKSDADCDTTAYAMRVIYMVGPSYVFGVILLLVGPYWTLCRACACCGCGTVPASGLSSCDVFRPKVYALICFIGICIAGILNDTTSAKLFDSFTNLLDVVESVPDVVGKEIDMVNRSLIVTRYSAASDSDYQENLFESNGLGESMSKIKQDLNESLTGKLDDVRSYLDYTRLAFLLIYSLPMGLGLLLGVSALCNCRRCVPGCVSFFTFVFMFLLWLLYGIALMLALVLGDVASEVDAINTGKMSILPAVASCDSTQFDSFRSDFNTIEMSTSKSACESLRDLCYQNSQTASQNAANSRVYDCTKSPYPDCNLVDFADMVVLLDSGLSTHDSVKALPNAKADGIVCQSLVPCTPQQCGDDCKFPNGTRSRPGKNSREMYTSFKAAESVSISLDTIGGRYGSCESLFSIVMKPLQGPCDDIVNASLMLFNCTGFGSMMAMAMVITLMYGQSRFMSFADAAATRKKPEEEFVEDAAKEPYE